MKSDLNPPPFFIEMSGSASGYFMHIQVDNKLSIV
jgi:hypothetical protein